MPRNSPRPAGRLRSLRRARHRRLARRPGNGQGLLSSIGVVAVALSGCGLVDGATARFNEAQEQQPSVVTIGVLAPLDGPSRVAGAGVVAAVEAAVAEAEPPPGWVVEVAAVDTYTESLAGADLTEELVDRVESLAADETVISVVGTTTTEEVLVAAPSLTEVSIPLLSPADQDPTHWRGNDASEPVRPWRAYGVTTILPDPQEAALAEHLAVVGASRVAVIREGSTASAESAEYLSRGVARRGGRVESTTVVTSPREARRAAAAPSARKADAVVVLGPTALVSAARTAVPGETLVAGVAQLLGEPVGRLDGVPDDILLARGGPAPDRGKRALQRRLDGSTSPGPYGVAAFDAAALVLEGLQRCLPRAEAGQVAAPVGAPPRNSCADDIVFALAEGLTGTVVLDDYGAREDMLATLGVTQGGRWQRL